jgi:replicative DNA helicase
MAEHGKNSIIPFNEELELHVLMGCIMDEGIADAVMSQCGEDHFCDSRNKALYQACRNSFDKSRACDMTLVIANLRDADMLSHVGGGGYLESALSMAIHAGILDDSLSMLHGYYLQRLVINKTAELSMKARGMDGYQAVDQLGEMATTIGSDFNQVVSERGDILLERLRGIEVPPKLILGVPELDEGIYKDAGMFRGQIEVTIADSSHGKTTWAMYKAIKLLQQGYKVAWYQLEDTPRKTLEDIFDVNPDLLKRFYITSEIRNIEDIKLDLRTLKRKHDIDYAVVDYIQNVRSSNHKYRHEVTEYASSELTWLMGELNIVGHILSQVTIDTSHRKGWKLEPRYSDVRQSQQIKQDAHLITSVFRPFVVHELVSNSGDATVDWNDNPVDRRSFFVKHQKVRGGEISHRRMHMIHTNKGPVPYKDFIDENQRINNSWREDAQF